MLVLSRGLFKFLIVLVVSSVSFAQRPSADILKSNNGDISIQPILHGTLVFQWDNKTIYVDPYGGSKAFEGIDAPDFILITDIHGDHLNLETLKSINTENATFVVPKAVAEKLPMSFRKKSIILKNGDIGDLSGILVTAIPMYNLPPDSDSYHTKGRGNGYVLNFANQSIYISGDTEDIPEMRNLRGIDIAFICMNLPYTMDIEQASDAVLAFKPRIVYPYHYRGKPEMSNTTEFKTIVNKKNPEIEVRLRNWYPDYDTD